ncbi:hypothetical protein QWY31_14395 [Cytophagales bacterium LB-30]|uniref:Uncharacterized protein n=1 Tax=Shiella aurantiaca TaxID=3058365 RepID=A0ABT8F8D2_9BACT|nr:hypothetical protein [Shiella aurantiaca]MDN4166697.1 hypothetical protein [Shiella aurantiaca]
MNKYIYLLLLLSLTLASSLSAQDKLEKESRIKPEEVPAQAMAFIDSLHLPAKVKWYREEGLEHTTIEAKYTYKKTRYSIEFALEGAIEDAEMELKWEAMAPAVQKAIKAQLEQDCDKHSIVKVQEQFTGSRQDLHSLLKTGTIAQGLNIKFEVVAKCKRQKDVNLYEYLFDDKGQVLAKSVIVFKNSSHLEY